MDVIEKKTVDMLTKDSVSILTRKFIEIDGQEMQIGENHRCSYVNSEDGRADLLDNEPEAVVNAVMAIWGNEPSIGVEGVAE